MRIRYNIDRSDLVRGVLRYMPINPSLRAAVMTGVFIVAAGAGIPSLMGISDLGWESVIEALSVAVGCSIGFAVLCSSLLIVGTCIEMLLGKRRGVICEHELEILDEGLAEYTTFNHSLHKWKQVKSIHETAEFFFIRIVENSPSFYLVPKMQFLNDSVLDEFIIKVRSRIQHAEQDVTPNA